MNKFVSIVVILCFLSNGFNCLFAQVTISPEIGVSHFPFVLGGASPPLFSKRVDLILGISAQLPLHERWYAGARVSYADREDWKWVDLCSCPDYQYSEYQHADLNLDFSLHYKFKEYLHLGLGPAIIYKLNAVTTIFDTVVNPEPIGYSEERFEYGVQSILTLRVRSLALKLEYARKLYNYELNRYSMTGRNRYNAVLAVPIRLKKRQR